MITHTAIQAFDGRIWALPKPARHGHVFRLIYATLGKAEADRMTANHVQGFVTDTGVFLDRFSGWREAVRCQQILPDDHPRRVERLCNAGTLYSDDLW